MPTYKLVVIAALLPAAIWAAEAWDAKPFEEWTSKDLQKLMSNSPWARHTTATVANADARGSSGIGDASNNNATTGNDVTAGRAARGAGGADRLGSAPSDLDRAPQGAGLMADVPVTIRWQSALPLRQAQMRVKYGKEAATSPESKKFLAQEPAMYVITVSGLSGSMVGGGAGDQAKLKIRRNSLLGVKGKEALHAAVVDFAPNGSDVDVLIGFPHDMPLAIEDQEAEFSTQIGPATIKYRFKLKEMVLRGKLEL